MLLCCSDTCSGMHYGLSLFRRTSAYESHSRQFKIRGSRNIAHLLGRAPFSRGTRKEADLFTSNDPDRAPVVTFRHRLVCTQRKLAFLLRPHLAYQP